MKFLCKWFGHKLVIDYYENNHRAGGYCLRCDYTWGKRPNFEIFGLDGSITNQVEEQ